ncbi:MAG TPA: phosphatase PAP2 family protein [Actinomycetales bacterium]|nr:phosphatase PAP2 family protein [Actinomycetales bacterium]
MTTPEEQVVTSFEPDQVIAEWFLSVAVANPILVDVGEVLAFALHPWTFRVAVAAAVVVTWRAGRRRAAAVFAVTMAFGGLLGLALKLTVQRPRPVWGDPVAAELGYSMPSGHSLNAALGSALLVGLAWPWLVRQGRTGVAVLLAGVVVALAMLDRLVLGVHYATDVLVGASIGVTLAVMAYRLTSRVEPVTP